MWETAYAVFLGERPAAVLTQSQTCPSKYALARHKEEGFDVRGACLHRGPLYCSLQSHHVGGEGENGTAPFSSSDRGSHAPTVQEAITE